MAAHIINQVEKSKSQFDAPRLSISLAAFVLICFFLPWLQVSCLGLQDAASGYHLARNGEGALWLVPLAMMLILLSGLVRWIWEQMPAVFALISLVGSGLSTWLMLRERADIGQGTGLIAAQWTVWFWLGVAAALGIAASALNFYTRRIRAP
ncbi:MAG TPA: hypothetical protein VEF04_16370 [Blastocatellia bacterium]|nr:hypothetical protein [Blastocatellia bacterium]